MNDGELSPILNHIRRLAGDAGGVSDATLLERFVANRDEAAFELLLRRHARLVFGVCRRVLRDVHDAEDAFQATFLALARRADRIARREAIAGWLYKVAYRAALTTRIHRSRQATRERAVGMPEGAAPPVRPTAALEQEELRDVLDEEVSALPARFQEAVVLCYLEGKTVDEAAVHLGCARGTVASRLARARARLQKRLNGRGVALAAGLAVAAESAEGAALHVIPSLVAAAVRPAAAGGSVSSHPAALAEEVLRTMMLHKLRTAVVLVVLCAGALLAGAGVGVRLLADAEPKPQQSAAESSRQITRATSAEKEPAKSAPVTVEVVHPVRRKFTPSEAFTGRLEPLETVEVKAQVSGYLLSVHFKTGATVKKGDLLFEIDPRPLQASLDRALANLRLAEGRKKQVDIDLKRLQRLGTVAAKEDVDKAAADVDAATAAVQVARADVERAKLMLGFSKVAAPISGRIGEPALTAGNLVSGEPGRATRLATIRVLDPIGVVFDMDERSFLDHQRLVRKHVINGVGGPLFVGFADEKGERHEGTLTGFGDQVNTATGAVQVRGRLPNRDGTLLPGMWARVRLPLDKERTVLEVPESAVRTDQGTHYVDLVDGDNRVERRQIATGPADGDRRVVEKGLRPEDRVIQGYRTPGNKPRGLRVGEQVKPQPKNNSEETNAK